MAQAFVTVSDGKAVYDGQTLSAWAPIVAERIIDRCQATKVVLYGSVARGDDTPDSDIDLLVVTRVPGRRHDAAVRVMNELRDIPAPVEITVVDPDHLEYEASVPGVVRAALREGRLLVDGA